MCPLPGDCQTGSGERRGRAADLRQQQSQGLQQGRLHSPGEAVSQDADERSGDVDHRGSQRFGGGQLDDSAQGFSRLLLLLGAAGEDPLPEDRQDTRHPLGRKRKRKNHGVIVTVAEQERQIQTSTAACKTQTQWDDMEKSPSRFNSDPFIRTQTHSALTEKMEFNEMKCNIMPSLTVLVT